MTLKIQTNPPTYLSVTGQKMPKIAETVFPLRFVFSVDLAFIKFALGVSAGRASRFLAWNVFLLLKRRAFGKEVSGTNLIPAVVIDPRTLAIYLFSLLGAVQI